MIEARLAKPRKERTENSARRRRQIIQATIDSIVLHGLSGTTLATVAAQAGLSQGSAVFYFQTKEQLFAETLKAHYEEYRAAWLAAFEAPHTDPVAHLVAFLLVDVSAEICSRRNLTLWHSFWGEAKARPRFAEIAAAGDTDRMAHLIGLVERAAPQMDRNVWTAEGLAKAMDALTDGLWMQLHMSRETMTRADARQILAQVIASAFPARRGDIIAQVTRAEPEAEGGDV